MEHDQIRMRETLQAHPNNQFKSHHNNEPKSGTDLLAQLKMDGVL
jgi:hypothetical protein